MKAAGELAFNAVAGALPDVLGKFDDIRKAAADFLHELSPPGFGPDLTLGFSLASIELGLACVRHLPNLMWACTTPGGPSAAVADCSVACVVVD